MEKRDGGGNNLRSLIEKATNSTSQGIDPRLLKAIKSTVRSSDTEIRVAVETLMEKMKKDHSQVRYLTLLIIDELFMRSKLFRSLLVVNFDQFLSLCIGFRRNMPLPPPPAIATKLRTKSIELLEKWNDSFGFHYRQLRLGFDYLKNTLKFQFPNLREHASRLQQERRVREIRSKEILLNKFESLKDNYSSIKGEIQSTLDEIGECLGIVRIKDNELHIHTDSIEDDEVEEFGHPALRQIRLDSLKEGERVHENSENKAVFDVLRELYKILVSRHLLSVQEWISILIRVDLSDNRFRDSALKEFIDIRNHLQSVKKRCEELGCALHNTDVQEDEDLWEEGKVEVHHNENYSIPGRSTDDLASSSTANDKDRSPKHNMELDGKERNHKADGLGSTSLRSSLLAEAPVMTWGSFLDNWGLSRDVLANQRGLELEGHWGRVDYDAVIPAEKIAELHVQATLYKETQLEIQPCRAPLSKGGLCERRDLRICPFHGPIVPRDAEGNPVEKSTFTDEKSMKETQAMGFADAEEAVDLGNKIMEQLAKQAVKNVRDRDREQEKKRHNDRKTLKRAKFAKVREHNEVVLREAALASTSQSEAIGEDIEIEHQNRLMGKEKKQTLASMLHKKVTTKDRLAKKLLNTRVTDAAIRQLSQGEDANYREAYPNQW